MTFEIVRVYDVVCIVEELTIAFFTAAQGVLGAFAFDQLAYPGDEFELVVGGLEKMVGTGFDSLDGVRGVDAKATQEQNWGAGEVQSGAQAAGEFDAVGLRHGEVVDDQVGFFVGSQSKGSLGVCSLEDVVAGVSERRAQ